MSRGVSVVIITFNEELNLPACLRSLQDVADEILIVDSGSTDGTIAIAEQYGAKVVHHDFEGHSAQWEWALANLPLANDWVLGLDADQQLTPELGAELKEMFGGRDTVETDVAGYYVARRNIFRGKWIRWGGYYPKYLLKLFRRSRLHHEDADLLDHHFRVDGPTAKLRGDIIEENRKEEQIDFWIKKHLRYADLFAQEELRRSSGRKPQLVRPALLGSPDQRAEWQKSTWNKLPRFVRPAGYFVWRYIFLLGFLDGKEGFNFHFLHAFWFRLIADMKIDELEGHARPGN